MKYFHIKAGAYYEIAKRTSEEIIDGSGIINDLSLNQMFDENDVELIEHEQYAFNTGVNGVIFVFAGKDVMELEG